GGGGGGGAARPPPPRGAPRAAGRPRRYLTNLSGSSFNGPEIAAGSEGVWFGDPNLHYVGKVDDLLSSGTASTQVDIPPDETMIDSAYNNFDGVAVGEGAVWVAGDPFGRTVWRVDPLTGRLAATIRVPFIPDAIAAGEGAVWVSSLLDDTVSRIDPATNRITATIAVGRGPDAIAVGAGAVWVTSSIDDGLWRIDPATNRVAARIPLHGTPTAVAVGSGAVWVTTARPVPLPPANTIKVGVYADCSGPFAGQYNDELAGAELALIRRGAKPDGPGLTDGVRGISIGGRPIM